MAGVRIQQQSLNGGRGLKTTKVQAFGGSNPSPSAFDLPPEQTPLTRRDARREKLNIRAERLN
jgi:hypothetical protein